MVAHAFHPRTQEAGAGGTHVGSQPGPYRRGSGGRSEGREGQRKVEKEEGMEGGKATVSGPKEGFRS